MTLAEINADITKYEAARDKALLAQSHGENGRNVTRANLDALERRLTELRAMRDRITAGGGMFAAAQFRTDN